MLTDMDSKELRAAHRAETLARNPSKIKKPQRAHSNSSRENAGTLSATPCHL